MSEKQIWIEFEDEHKILRGLILQEKRWRNQAKHLVEDIGTFGLRTLKSRAPNFTSYTVHHADKSSAKFKPGGLGGGGEYEVIVGIKSGTSSHPLYAEQGTGLYGPQVSYIVPTSA